MLYECNVFLFSHMMYKYVMCQRYLRQLQTVKKSNPTVQSPVSKATLGSNRSDQFLHEYYLEAVMKALSVLWLYLATVLATLCEELIFLVTNNING